MSTRLDKRARELMNTSPGTSLSDARDLVKTQDAIERILQANPDLCGNGLRPYERGKDSQEGDRERGFGNDPRKVLTLARYLRRHYEFGTRVVNDDRLSRSTSYGIKHHYQEAAGVYVDNGTFIIAALCAGYAFEPRTPGSPNALFNFRYRDVVRAPGSESRWEGRNGHAPAMLDSSVRIPESVWRMRVDVLGRDVSVYDMMDAVVTDTVVDMLNSYDPLDEADPIQAFADVVTEDLRIDGPKGLRVPHAEEAECLYDALLNGAIEAHRDDPKQGFPGRYSVKVCGKEFTGPIEGLGRHWVYVG